ncbi:cellulose binding domain-containing protein [Kitasatospora griseola]|uniref:cellulose binding domain-containing protein n=1 Tax=Kitasatospora griseola TaxID=2064 RepID=UPI0009F8F465
MPRQHVGLPTELLDQCGYSIHDVVRRGSIVTARCCGAGFHARSSLVMISRWPGRDQYAVLKPLRSARSSTSGSPAEGLWILGHSHTLTNHGTTPIHGWTVRLDLTENTTVTSAWRADHVQHGHTVLPYPWFMTGDAISAARLARHGSAGGTSPQVRCLITWTGCRTDTRNLCTPLTRSWSGGFRPTTPQSH